MRGRSSKPGSAAPPRGTTGALPTLRAAPAAKSSSANCGGDGSIALHSKRPRRGTGQQTWQCALKHQAKGSARSRRLSVATQTAGRRSPPPPLAPPATEIRRSQQLFGGPDSPRRRHACRRADRRAAPPYWAARSAATGCILSRRTFYLGGGGTEPASVGGLTAAGLADGAAGVGPVAEGDGAVDFPAPEFGVPALAALGWTSLLASSSRRFSGGSC